MPMTLEAPTPHESVLSTLNRDGSRRWIRPKPSRGLFHRRRRAVAWLLILIFTAIPYIPMGGKPLILLDIAHREFTLFGTTFLATDTVILMLFLVGLLVGVFLLTAIFGRVWCGWGCPQSVYMEFLYRPLERFIEGGRSRQLELDRTGPDGRRILKHFVFLLVSMFLAHVFLAYFVGVAELFRWIRLSPVEHPTAFLVMAVTTALMFFDFAYFREQTCVVACPYGRLQSVLLDRQSLIVGYDRRRGEPRGRLRRRRPPATSAEEPLRGDCIDCRLCVVTCPTGIDIREGLQMECIACTQCIDACDRVMERIGRPRGLIRYTSQDELEGRGRSFLRPRVIAYPAVMLTVVILLCSLLLGLESTEVTVLRDPGSAFSMLPEGAVSNRIRIKIVNRDRLEHSYHLSVTDLDSARIIIADNPVQVPAGESFTAAFFVVAPREVFDKGRREISIRVADDAGFVREARCILLGPYQGGSATASPSGRDRHR
ncbi:MAG: cytochrome c oxidase accessory protein CcoG [Planctomycetota bacterium]